MMISTLDAYNLSSFKDDPLSYHRLTEIFKFAYARRTRLGDPKFVNISEVSVEFVKLDTLLGASVLRFSLSISLQLHHYLFRNDFKLALQMASKKLGSETQKHINDSQAMPIEFFNVDSSVPGDRGTSHATFFAPDGDVLVISSTVNDE